MARSPGGGRILAALALGLVAGCSEDAITDVSSGAAPGSEVPTVEISLRSSDFVSFQDTTYVGFSVPSTSGFVILSDASDLKARWLGRFGNLPTTVGVDTLVLTIERFEEAGLRLVVDVANSQLPDSTFLADSVLTFSAFLLASSFDVQEVTWLEAFGGQPWLTPGGDLSMLLGKVRLDSLTPETFPDTITIPFAGPVDSLLSAWRDGDGQPGVLLTMSGPGVTLRLGSVALTAEAFTGDTLLSVARSATAESFIFDPVPPAPGSILRLGGLPSSRIYMRFSLPEAMAGLELRGSVINDAAVLLTPLASPEEPFNLAMIAAFTAFRILGDPIVEGPKVPIGRTLSLLAGVLDPDSLSAGVAVEFSVRDLINEWAANDSIEFINLGLRMLPEGSTFGAWGFASSESPESLQPTLRLIVTPPSGFDLP